LEDLMEEEWGPWIDGTIAPPVGAFAQLHLVDKKGRGDMMHEAIVLAVDDDTLFLSPEVRLPRLWELERFRIRKPKALRELIDMVENLPVREDA
jgi:hypothetical protein